MKIILILLILLVIVFFLLKKKKNVDVTTSTTTQFTPITTNIPKDPFWYVLYRCDDQQTYYVGPYYDHEYDSGQRVEGATDIYYVVKSTTNIKPDSVIAGITSTGNMGC
jgi:hypothetical protein